jgi:hypothetical protein
VLVSEQVIFDAPSIYGQFPQEGTFGQKSSIRDTLNYHHLNKNIDILYRTQIKIFRLYNGAEHLE